MLNSQMYKLPSTNQLQIFYRQRPEILNKVSLIYSIARFNIQQNSTVFTIININPSKVD